MGCVGLKKERTSVSDVIIADVDVDKNALLYLQLAAQIKELETQQDSLKASFEGLLGVTNSGIEVSWTTVKGRVSRLRRTYRATCECVRAVISYGEASGACTGFS